LGNKEPAPEHHECKSNDEHAKQLPPTYQHKVTFRDRLVAHQPPFVARAVGAAVPTESFPGRTPLWHKEPVAMELIPRVVFVVVAAAAAAANIVAAVAPVMEPAAPEVVGVVAPV
jgi:hypothetical protein